MHVPGAGRRAASAREASAGAEPFCSLFPRHIALGCPANIPPPPHQPPGLLAGGVSTLAAGSPRNANRYYYIWSGIQPNLPLGVLWRLLVVNVAISFLLHSRPRNLLLDQMPSHTSLTGIV